MHQPFHAKEEQLNESDNEFCWCMQWYCFQNRHQVACFFAAKTLRFGNPLAFFALTCLRITTHSLSQSYTWWHSSAIYSFCFKSCTPSSLSAVFIPRSRSFDSGQWKFPWVRMNPFMDFVGVFCLGCLNLFCWGFQGRNSRSYQCSTARSVLSSCSTLLHRFVHCWITRDEFSGSLCDEVQRNSSADLGWYLLAAMISPSSLIRCQQPWPLLMQHTKRLPFLPVESRRTQPTS